MRASRLLSIMMLLQARGRMSAEALADELEVSVRTIYRDIDQLSAAGVPVYADIGRNGGFALLDGWRTRLTGLTAPEARALFLSGLPGPASELGLGDEVAAAELKLLAALPADWQSEATRMSSRFHLDPKGWFSTGPRPEFLKAVAEAVWTERRILITYDSWTQVSERLVEPLGLVLKGGVWYLVGRRESGMRTYRLSQIQALTLTDEQFERPAEFDLPRHWQESTAAFEREVYVGVARVRATRIGVSRLKDISQRVKDAIEAQALAFDADGWAALDVPVEEERWASREMTRVGAEVEVLAPETLRTRMVEIATRLARSYGLVE
ncbi:MAG: DNA-binding transcriptional regulator [Devosia sp. 67-54]|uniref:helix-turn-helix transcriptional regulator n=1 Tax=unclassified Devosia TaxID=196773 RepID=UPI000868AAE3|nr:MULTISPECIES: YafY family protein [unclassified Devosia]MBN9304860.1 YafY family transcriptional regulator [Devosia sp.]ODU62070.1 MAG: DNA-binding transcriptional regulator [Acetobacteraceae bacterium SCN 69-10]OJX15186.1 MAG: DNA-binding transcriptional regulator [Devosia sp. 67-54]